MATPASLQVVPAETPTAVAKIGSPGTEPPSPAERPVRQDRPAATARDTRGGGAAKTASKPAQLAVAAPPAAQIDPPITSLSTRQETAPSTPPVVTAAPVASPPKQETTVPAGAAPTTADIAPTVEAYARAIESRDIGAIRRIYPGLTSEQQRGFEQFFQAARSVNVTFRVTNVDGSSTSADARLVGSYEYVTTAGKTERQPVNFAATLRHDANGWRLVSVR